MNYISRFISQISAKCDLIFKLLKKHDSGEWTEECQIVFDKVKDYLSTPPILVPPIPEKPLILYLIVHEKSMGYVLGQHDETRKKEHAIYYLSKKFTKYESNYPPVEKMCCALAWTAQRLRQYMLYHTTWFISKLDPSSIFLRNHQSQGGLRDGKSYCRNMTFSMYPRKQLKEVPL